MYWRWPPFLKSFSAWLFYLLGISFFVAYMFAVNEMYVPWPKFWLSIADLPLLLAGMIYGGTSLFLSVKQPQKKSPVLASFIVIPLTTLFIFLALMNFWPVISISN